MGRKYKQQGYQEIGQKRSGGEKPQPAKQRSSEGPRSPRMPGFQEVMRCAICGNIVSTFTEVNAESQCSKCGSDLQSCKHCRHFDTGALLECTQAIPERVVAKDKRNDCEFFEARTSVEKQTSSPSSVTSPSTPKDARSAFDDLFR